MATITLEDQPVLSGVISMPRLGAWTAELITASQTPLTGSVSLSDGTVTFRGTVSSGGVFGARNHVRVIGGAGGLGGVIQSRHHRSASVNKILGDICADSGEKKSGLILPTISRQIFPYWSRPVGTGGGAVSDLADALGVVWRILPTGEVWIGDPSVPYAAPAEFAVLSRAPHESSFTIAIDDLSLWVGMSQEGGQIQRIEYTLDERRSRARYWVD